MLASDTDPSALAGLELVDRRGERIGRIRQLYPDGDRLGWAGVRGNLLGTEEALVPLDGAVLDEDVVGLPISRARFQAAPRRRPDTTLDDAERERLRRYWAEPAPEPLGAPAAPAREQDPAADARGTDEVTAYQERLHVETERVPRTRIRLRKVVVTEERTVTVPVRREEYRVIREPIEAGEAVPGGAIGESDQEVVLYEERVVVSTEVVAVERVRLVKEEVVEQRSVSGTVRGERIELEEDGTALVPAPLEPEVVEPAEAAEEDAEDAEEVAPVRALRPAAGAGSTKRPSGGRAPRTSGSTAASPSADAASGLPPAPDDGV